MKRSFAILLAVAVFAACGTRPEATLNVTVTGVDEGTVVYLMNYPPTAILDSAVVEGGKFRFEFADTYPSGRILKFDADSGMYPFIVEAGAITATVNPNEGAVFSGTPANDSWNSFRDDAVELEAKLYASELRSDYDAAMEEYNEYIAKVVRANANTVFAAFLMDMQSQSETSFAVMDSLLNLVSGAPANAFTERVRERRDLLARTSVGKPAPDFTLDSPDGAPFTLSSLRGKLVLIDFWASWCGPCREENPNVVKLYDRFRNKGFEIVGVSVDENRAAWLETIEEDGLIWIQVLDAKGVVGDLYQVKFIPHTVLVSPDGVIITKDLRGEGLEAKVAEILDVTK